MSSGGSNVSYKQSPEQREIYQTILPLIQQLSTAGQTGTSAYSIPAAPAAPSFTNASGVYSSVPSYTPQGYSIPTYTPQGYSVPNAVMPTSDWYSNLSSDVKAGIMAPYKEGEQQLMETLGSGGGLGSARGGFSGSGAAGLGRYWGEAAPQIGLSAWNMTQPGLQAQFEAQLGQNQYLANQQNLANQWGAEAQMGQNQYLSQLQNQAALQEQQNLQQENLMNWTGQSQQTQQDYSSALSRWQAEQQAMAMPYSILPGMLGGTYSQPVVSQGSTKGSDIMGLAGMLGGAALMGGTGGAAAPVWI